VGGSLPKINETSKSIENIEGDGFVRLMKKLVVVLLVAIFIASGWQTPLANNVYAATVDNDSRFIAPITPINNTNSWTPISNRTELEAIRNNLDGLFFLTADIDLSGREWTPIGNRENPFAGVLDGQGHVIRNMTITSEINATAGHGRGLSMTAADYGLFGSVRGSAQPRNLHPIMNLGLENVNINLRLSGDGVHDINVGGLIGGSQDWNLGITNSFVTGSISVVLRDARERSHRHISVGGLVGNWLTSARYSFNTADISVHVTADESQQTLVSVGGVAGSGSLWSNRNFNAGNIIASVDVIGRSYPIANLNVGGILGRSDGNVAIIDSYNLGNVEASASALGMNTDFRRRDGRVGPSAQANAHASGLANGGRIEGSFNAGNVSSSANSNGIDDGSSRAISAGLSWSGVNNITNSASLAHSIISSHDSHILGSPERPTTNSFAVNDVRSSSTVVVQSNIMYPRNAFGYSSFWVDLLDFDFENIWEMSAYGYPVFKGMGHIRPTNNDFYAVTKRTLTFHAGAADEGYRDVDLDIYWGWDLFSNSSTIYDNRLAIVALALANAATHSEGRVREMLGTGNRGLGFHNIEPFNYPDSTNRSQPAHTIASRRISLNGEDYNLIVIVNRGSSDLGDWRTNADFINGITGTNLSAAVDSVYQNVLAHMDRHFPHARTSDKNIFFITGYSLGGAIANSLSDLLNIYAHGTIASTHGIGERGMFVYTFAAPNNRTAQPNPDRLNVFNIINLNDVVPLLDVRFGYRFGEIRAFGSGRHNLMVEPFSQLTNGRNLFEYLGDYSNNILGAAISPRATARALLAAHDTTVYMAYLLSR